MAAPLESAEPRAPQASPGPQSNGAAEPAAPVSMREADPVMGERLQRAPKPPASQDTGTELPATVGALPAVPLRADPAATAQPRRSESSSPRSASESRPSTSVPATPAQACPPSPQPAPSALLMARVASASPAIISGAQETPSPSPSPATSEAGGPEPARDGRIAFGLNLRPVETDAAAKSATPGNAWQAAGASGAAGGSTAGEAPAQISAAESVQPADWRMPQERPEASGRTASAGTRKTLESPAPPDLPAATDDTSSPAQNGRPPARQSAGNVWASPAENASQPAATAAGPVRSNSADAGGGREGASAQDNRRGAPGHDRRPAASSERAPDLVQPATEPIVSPAAVQTVSAAAPTWTAEARTQFWRTDEAPSHASSAAGPAAPQPEPERLPTTPARDIRIALDGGERRVEVRVVERGGGIQVAVRTPDERLAGDLRSDLPALTARLEQAGYRADSWHPPAAPRHAEARPGATAGEQDDGSGQHESSGQDRRQQQQEQFEPPAGRKAQPKESSWLFPSLQ